MGLRNTAHQALKMTLDAIPQRGGYVSAQPKIKKFKVMKQQNTAQ